MSHVGRDIERSGGWVGLRVWEITSPRSPQLSNFSSGLLGACFSGSGNRSSLSTSRPSHCTCAQEKKQGRKTGRGFQPPEEALSTFECASECFSGPGSLKPSDCSLSTYPAEQGGRSQEQLPRDFLDSQSEHPQRPKALSGWSLEASSKPLGCTSVEASPMFLPRPQQTAGMLLRRLTGRHTWGLSR